MSREFDAWLIDQLNNQREDLLAALKALVSVVTESPGAIATADALVAARRAIAQCEGVPAFDTDGEPKTLQGKEKQA